MNHPDLPFLTYYSHDLMLRVYIQPRAAKNQMCGVQGDELKIRLTSPPVDGAANKLCREFIADYFGVAKSSVEIVSGEASRHKRIRVSGNQADQFTTQLSALEDALRAGQNH